jgi:hypothetical protein
MKLLDQSTSLQSSQLFRGVLLVANGERDAARSRVLLHSLALTGYEGPVLIINDSHRCGFASRAYKVGLPTYSPFEQTLFLDSDIVVLRPFSALWEHLERADLWMGPDIHASVGAALKDRSARAQAEEIEQTRVVCPANQPYFNSGVILFKRSAKVSQFFRCWETEWLRFQRVDQLAASRASVALDFYPSQLGLKYNYPLRNWSRAPKSESVFVHCWGTTAQTYDTVTSRLPVFREQIGSPVSG